MSQFMIPAAPFGRDKAYKLPRPLRISAMIGLSLMLWSAILLPFLV